MSCVSPLERALGNLPWFPQTLPPIFSFTDFAVYPMVSTVSHRSMSPNLRVAMGMLETEVFQKRGSI